MPIYMNESWFFTRHAMILLIHGWRAGGALHQRVAGEFE